MIDIHPHADAPGPGGAPTQTTGTGAPTGPTTAEHLVIHRTSRARRRSRRRATVIYGLSSLLFLGLLVGLGDIGYHASRRVRGGFTTTRITDPAAPGYEVAVLPTPVHLAALVDDSGHLVDFYVFIRGSGASGNAVVWILGDEFIGVPGQMQSLAGTFASGGIDAARTLLEKLLGFGMSDTVLLAPDQVEAMFARVGPVTIQNPDAVYSGTGASRQLAYASGELTLTPTQVSAFLRFKTPGEVPANRATRARLVMDAYFTALKTSTDANGPTVATDKGVDLTATASAMAAGEVDFEILPLIDKPFTTETLYEPDTAAVAKTITKLVPFPVSAFPGQRPRVRILSSTTNRSAPQAAAPSVVDAGGEILVIGNSKVADAAATVVEYHDPSQASAAGQLAAIFGVTAVASREQTETYDITITLGTEYHG